MSAYIQLDHVSKRFGDREVLHPLTIEFERGKIHGIIGRNGSGKTVMMKLILGILLPSQGQVIVNGKRIGKEIDFPTDTGAIIENVEFLSYLNAQQNLENLAAIHRKIGKKEVEEVLKTVGLENTGKKKVGKFSLGMRQRLAIAQAIMEHPKLIVLDEPMNGLDKSGVEEMRKVFSKLRDEGTTMILASHNMEDIQCLCDEIYEMESESAPESSEEKMTSDFVETSSSEIPKVAVKLNSEQQHSEQQTSRAQESSSTVSQKQSQESNVPSQAKTEPKVTESAAEESVAPVPTADLTSEDNSTTSVSQESTTSTEWYQVTGEVVEGDGDAKGIAVYKEIPEYFMISFYASANDDVPISNVRIAVWTEANGQDDIEWINAETGGVSARTTIYAKNHNNETSGYIVHVYYTDRNGVEKVYYHPETISISQ